MRRIKICLEILNFTIFKLELSFGKKHKEEPLSTNITEVKKNSNCNTERENNPNYKGTFKPDLKAFEEKSQEKEKSKIVTCNSCKGTAYEEDTFTCSKCGKDACTNCGSYDSYTNKNYCDTCWLAM